MCKFFSCVSDGKGRMYYFDNKLRQKCLSGKLKNFDPDSHTSIATYFGFKGKKEDSLNKYEYDPFSTKFEIDQINTLDDSKDIEKKVRKLDFSKIVNGLVIKPIIHPFNDIENKRILKKDIENLKKWDSVWNSVRDSVWNSVWNSVGNSVGASVGNPVRDSVWNSVGASIGNSVRDSVWNSVWNSVGAYTSSFFNIPKWKYIKHRKGVNPFQSCIDLWDRGLVPAYDGTYWYLLGTKDVKILKKFDKNWKEIK